MHQLPTIRPEEFLQNKTLDDDGDNGNPQMFHLMDANIDIIHDNNHANCIDVFGQLYSPHRMVIIIKIIHS
ncbi:hypothetical protein BLA29_010931 [Euroglyphus maynei]|uniref:Uncharacterized protein n=1 Tax=Euroglyphus maynei TaxID=6958 RepID=A0A1Y3B0Q7_EURMA|nr:hypothetical protein BLA29_010931 [Euroglyphus maynei]